MINNWNNHESINMSKNGFALSLGENDFNDLKKSNNFILSSDLKNSRNKINSDTYNNLNYIRENGNECNILNNESCNESKSLINMLNCI
jgi:hypothetical protein